MNAWSRKYRKQKTRNEQSHKLNNENEWDQRGRDAQKRRNGEMNQPTKNNE